MTAKTEVLDTLFDARDAVSTMIIQLNPSNPAETQQLQKLMKRRDALTGSIQEVIEAAFTESTVGLQQATSNLENAVDKLSALDKTLDNVAAALGYVDQILQLVVAVLAAAAAA